MVEGEDVVLLGGWYAAADGFLFPSVREGFGLVVASDLPVFREYLRDGVNALLPGVGDEEALAAAMRRIVEDPVLRARLRDGAAPVHLGRERRPARGAVHAHPRRPPPELTADAPPGLARCSRHMLPAGR